MLITNARVSITLKYFSLCIVLPTKSVSIVKYEGKNNLIPQANVRSNAIYYTIGLIILQIRATQ